MMHRLTSFRPGCFTLYLGLCLIFQLETLLVAPSSDSAAWLYMGLRMNYGEMPGRDLWDNKLPLIYLIGWAAMTSGRPQFFLWLLEATVTALGAVATAAIVSEAHRRNARQTNIPVSESPHTHRSSSTAALLAGALFCIVSGATSYHAGGFMTEIYAAPLSAAGAWAMLRALHGHPHRRALNILAGLCWTLAVSFRLPLGAAAVACALTALVLARRAKPSSVQRVITPTLLVLITGALIGQSIVFAHPMVAGYLPDIVDCAILWPLGIGHERIPGPFAPTTAERLKDFAQSVARLGWLHAAVVASLVLAFRRPAGNAPAGDDHHLLTGATLTNAPPGAARTTGHATVPDGSRGAVVFVALWYAAAVASALIGWNHYSHYQYVAFPPLCTAIGLGFAALDAHPARRLHARRAAAALIGVTAIVVAVQVTREAMRDDPDAADRQAIAEYVESHVSLFTSPENTVFIWAWGNDARLLYELNRSPGTRHFLAHSYLDMDQALYTEFLEGLSPPGWIIEDIRRDEPPLFSSWPLADREQKRAHATLDEGLYQYQEVITRGRYRLWKHKRSDS